MRRPIARPSDRKLNGPSSPPPPPVSSPMVALTNYAKPAMVVLACMLLAILTWSVQYFAPSWSTPLASHLRLQREPETVPFDIGGATTVTYSAFITELRDKLKDKKSSYFGIPMMPKPTKPANYIYVALRLRGGNTITIAVDKNDLYVVGYSDTFGRNVRARFFDDAPKHAKDTLFPDAKGSFRERNIGYTSQYSSIQEKAKVTKKGLGLGITTLKERVESLYGKDTSDKGFVQTEAKFFLVAIQTVSEAIRFKYIEGQINVNFDVGHFTPNPKVLSLEEEWGKITKGFRGADPKTGQMKESDSRLIKLKDEHGKEWKVTNVNQIKDDMGMLKYEA